MFKRRFIPYIVGACIVTFLSISYVGYRAYQNHVEFERFIAGAEGLNRPIEVHRADSSRDHTHSGDTVPDAIRAESEPEHHHHAHAADGKYVYEVAGVSIYADSPMSQKDLEMEEWLITGNMTPAAEEYLKKRIKQEEFDGQVIQRVVDPDGKIHTVLVPTDHQYEEGDAVLRSELDVVEQLKPEPSRTATISISGVDYTLPSEYYAIEDRYERAQYQMKFIQSKQLGISMAEADRRIAAGEMNLSLSPEERRRIDQKAEIDERRAMLGTQIIMPPLSDKPPVKVDLLPDDGETQPGWMRKLQGNLPSGNSKADGNSEYAGIDTVGDTPDAPVRSDAPRSLSDVPSISELGAVPAQPSEPPSVEQIQSQLRERLSPTQFGKAQQLIDQFGTEEGLRRLREMAPEAARRFESDKSSPPAREQAGRERRPVPSRDMPDGEQSESGSKD